MIQKLALPIAIMSMLKNNNCIGRASRNTSAPRARRPDPNYMPPTVDRRR